MLAFVGFAAAVVVVGAIGQGLLRGGLTGSSSSSAGAAQLSSASAAGSGGAAPSADGSADSAIGSADRSLHIELLASGTAYTAADLKAQATLLLNRNERSTVADLPALGPMATLAGAAACLHSLGRPRSEPAVIDLATFNGQPAAIVVTRPSSGTSSAYVVPRSCATGPSRLLQAALPLH